MKNSDMPAMPIAKSIEDNPPRRGVDPLGNYWVKAHGLTKLEHFAGLAMQGYIAADRELDNGPAPIAEWAVQNAKALLKELEKQK